MRADDRMTLRERPSRGAGIGLAVLFFVFAVSQLWTIDYGTRFNDPDHIQSFTFDAGALSEAFERQSTVIATNKEIPESPAKAAMRFKLYSVNPDEHLSIMALSRMKPGKLEFDPGYYQYGGAFLFPLGVWYFGLSKVGAIEVRSLEKVLNGPEGLDRVYVAGRIFVLLAFLLAAWVLYRTFLIVTDSWSALWALGIFLFVPATAVYGVLTKPHWYALLWVCAGLYVLVRGWTRGEFRFRDELALGILGGLAVSSIPFNPGPALLLGFAVFAGILDKSMNPSAVIRIPLVSILSFFITSPYFFLNFATLAFETTHLTARLDFSPSLERIWWFIANPLALGFGIALPAMLLGLGFYRLALRRGPMTWWAASLLVGTLLFYTYLTQGLASGPLSYRHIGFLLPVALLIAVSRPWPHRAPVLAAVFALTVLQALPIKMAYLDENDSRWGTRLAAANWISAEIPEGASICAPTSSFAPFRFPPIDVTRYRLVGPDCDYRVVAAVHPAENINFDNYLRTKEFAPRGWNDKFAFVHGHVNPHIAIHRRIESDAPD